MNEKKKTMRQISLEKIVKQLLQLADHFKVGRPFLSSSQWKPLYTTNGQSAVQCSRLKLSHTVCRCRCWRISVLLHRYCFILYHYKYPLILVYRCTILFVSKWTSVLSLCCLSIENISLMYVTNERYRLCFSLLVLG